MQFKATGDTLGSKHFVKLKSGEAIVGVFRGEPYEFKQHWINDRSTLCKGEGCEECAAKNKPSFRFRLNFITKEADNTYVCKIFEQSWKVYQALKGLHEGDYNLEKTIVRIMRNGTGQQTTYMILPVKDSSVSPQVESILAQIKLHDLQNLKDDSQPSSESFDDIPF